MTDADGQRSNEGHRKQGCSPRSEENTESVGPGSSSEGFGFVCVKGNPGGSQVGNARAQRKCHSFTLGNGKLDICKFFLLKTAGNTRQNIHMFKFL